MGIRLLKITNIKICEQLECFFTSFSQLWHAFDFCSLRHRFAADGRAQARSGDNQQQQQDASTTLGATHVLHLSSIDYLSVFPSSCVVPHSVLLSHIYNTVSQSFRLENPFGGHLSPLKFLLYILIVWPALQPNH